jgi:replicative DNA helicase
MSEKIKEMPNSIEAEQATIGAILVDNKAIHKVLQVGVKPDDFYRLEHQEIMRAATQLASDHFPVDIITVMEELKRIGKLDMVGGQTYLMQLAVSVPNAVNVEYYARIVKKKAKQRELIKAGADISSLGFNESTSFDDLISNAFQRLLDVVEVGHNNSYISSKEVLNDLLQEIKTRYEKKGKLSGIESGFPSLDRITSGFQNSDLIIIAARPGVGKTSIALNMVAHIAADNGIPVALFSLEMSRNQIMEKMLSSVSGVDVTKIRTGFLSESDWNKLVNGSIFLYEAPIFIDDSPRNTLTDIKVKSKMLKAEHNVGIIFVDYLQLIRTEMNFENRVLEIGEVTSGLKGLAKDLNVPIVVLSQLNRSVEKRENKVPVLSDLRESGSIEQDADIVMFLHNPDENDKEQTNLIIAKHRNGPTGEVRLVFHKEYSKFVELQDNK